MARDKHFRRKVRGTISDPQGKLTLGIMHTQLNKKPFILMDSAATISASKAVGEAK